MEKDGTKPAPEGGWGYVVCFGVIITFISCIGHVNSFGLIYNDFINETKSTARSLTLAHGVFAMMLAIGGLILNVMSKKISLRLGGLIGAVIFCVGSFTNVFITSTNQLPFTFGVLQGIGFGIMVPVSYSIMNYYFIRKRTTVMSTCKAIQGIVLMWYPQVLRKMVTYYGFRGTLLLLSAVSLHNFPGMAIMRINFSKTGKQNSTNQIESRNGKGADESVDLLNRDGNTEVANNNHESKETRKRLTDILMPKLLKDLSYLNICIGQSFVNFSDLTFFMLQPMLLFQYGYSRKQVATCISIAAAADVAGRCALAIISSMTSVNTRVLFYIASVLTLILRIVLLQVEHLMWIVTVTAALGILRAWLHVTSPLVISNHVTHEDFPGAYSIFMLITGLVNLAVSPVIGILKDVYEDYRPAFYALSLCCLPCTILWPIEFVLAKKST